MGNKMYAAPQRPGHNVLEKIIEKKVVLVARPWMARLPFSGKHPCVGGCGGISATLDVLVLTFLFHGEPLLSQHLFLTSDSSLCLSQLFQNGIL